MDKDLEQELNSNRERKYASSKFTQEMRPNATEYEDQTNLNTDRLIEDLRSQNNATQVSRNNQKAAKNFESHVPQKSDDFKITFAYTSKKSSTDFGCQDVTSGIGSGSIHSNVYSNTNHRASGS